MILLREIDSWLDMEHEGTFGAIVNKEIFPEPK